VTLLGTGNPRPSMERFGPSILVEGGEKTVLLDVGRGSLQRLFQIGAAEKVREVDLVLFTHLHSDHVNGFSDLWLTGWIFGRDRPLRVEGPTGTKSMCEHLERAYAFDRKVRASQYDPEGILLEPKDVGTGVVFDEGGMKIVAFEVAHGGEVQPAYGYRVDYHGRSAAFSGDTHFYEPIVEQARGVDVLVHEVISPEVEERRAQVVTQEAIDEILSQHASPEQVGRIFARVKPRLAVYSHIVPSPATAEDLIPPTRKTYDGPLAVGYDLMTIEIGETIEVYPRRTVSDR
jgi:ribonuclease Z